MSSIILCYCQQPTAFCELEYFHSNGSVVLFFSPSVKTKDAKICNRSENTNDFDMTNVNK